ncbi:MAG TPA: trypsin-like peptidase domain-containing protein [Gemmatimonadales bacterium]|nr:trypsin-like peptidase domain-containing protein [Gemmatimonadales bacterium]
MSTRDKNWLKLGGLATAAFALGLLFAGILDLPLRTEAQGRPGCGTPIVPVRAPAPDAAVRMLSDLSDAYAEISERAKPSVVYVQSTIAASDEERRPTRIPNLPPGFQIIPPGHPRVERGSGSGFIVSPDGYILTNNHVVEGADKVTVRLLDRREFTARVVGADPATDVAVIKIEASGLTPMPFGNSDDARVGEMVLAIGNPLGNNLTFTVTSGIISAKGRRLADLERQDGRSIGDFIQTDAAINPGNSGGPLVNIRGEVIGINSAIASETGTFTGYGFAIPINLARQVMDQLVANGRVTRAALGVLVKDAGPNDADFVGLDAVRGVVVQDWSGDDSPAKAAGIQRGDVIVSIDGTPVNYTGQLQQTVGFKPVGTTVHVEVARQGGVRRTYDVRLVSGDAAPRIARANAGSGDDGKGKDASGNPVSNAGQLLGVSVTPLTSAMVDRFQLREQVQGLVVTDVDEAGPAADQLIDEAQGGPDIITAVNGRAVRNENDLRDALRSVGSGHVASLDIYNARSDTRRVERVRLGQ